MYISFKELEGTNQCACRLTWMKQKHQKNALNKRDGRGQQGKIK